MKFMLTAISILLALVSLSCREKEAEQKEPQARQQQQVQMQQVSAALRKAVVQEVIQTTSYTYLKVKEADSEFWMAVTKRQIEAGATISFAGGLGKPGPHLYGDHLSGAGGLSFRACLPASGKIHGAFLFDVFHFFGPVFSGQRPTDQRFAGDRSGTGGLVQKCP